MSNAKAARCPYRARHWFTVRGTVGCRAPVCTDCGTPNPRPLTEDEWARLLQLAALRSVGHHVRTAIEAREAERRG